MRTSLRWTRAMGILAVLAVTAAGLAGCSHLPGGGGGSVDAEYLVGKGRRDITGPLSEVQMFGFVREGQTTAGVHIRLWSRAFVIAEAAKPKNRLVLVTADLGSMPHEIQRDVVDRLQEEYGDIYRLDNVILAATHTHSGPGGYWHYGAGSPLGGAFYQEHYDALVAGITQSIVDAHESMEPADILIGRGDVEGAGANRSRVAYLNNPDEEIARYPHDTDRTMTLLRFNGENGPIGSINWFAVHPTAMTYNNRLISGDHKGFAEQEFEARWERRGDANYEDAAFVAAFANSNCGDVTANLNLNNTGPGKDEFETTQIIGQRQLDVAWQLFQSVSDPLTGPIRSIQGYVDFSSLDVDAAWTRGAGPQRTCASAYGYAFAAGSTEDGGGHPLFREGMLEPNAMIDGIAANLFGRSPSAEIRACHLPKVVLFAPGETDPPQQAQVLPLGIARVGQLVFVVHPGEITTMAGRRVRETVAAALGTTPEWVVVAAYANDFSGYTTTHEEYLTQQYEGGHTLYGPWQLAGYQQEYDRLSRKLTGTLEPTPEENAAAKAEPAPTPRDLRGQVESVALGKPHDPLPGRETYGQVLEEPNPGYTRGSQVRFAVRTGNPQNDFSNGGNTVTIERRGLLGWSPVFTDRDWSTKFIWSTDPMPAEEWPLTAEELAAVMAVDQQAGSTGADASGEATPAQASADASGSAAPAPAGEAAAASPDSPMASRATITWDIPANMEPGIYRMVFHGAFKDGRGGPAQRFDAASGRFAVR